jgi:hypothetical protein
MDYRSAEALTTIEPLLVQYVRHVEARKGATRNLTVVLRDGSKVTVVGTPPDKRGGATAAWGLAVQMAYLPPAGHPRLPFPTFGADEDGFTINSDEVIEHALLCYLVARGTAIIELLGDEFEWFPGESIAMKLVAKIRGLPAAKQRALLAALISPLPNA